MSFGRADAVGMVAALALLFSMAADWYSTREGDEARRIERSQSPPGGTGGQVPREVEERAREVAEGEERNAWQPRDALDRVILAALLATAGLALAAGWLKLAGRRPRPPWTPSALAAVLGALTALLVGFRMLDQPDGATVGAGAPIALVLLGVLVLACASAARAEEVGAASADVARPES